MKPRDLAIVGAVLLLAGFAALDALRDRVDDPSNGDAATSTRIDRPTTSEPAPANEAAQPAGRLVLTDEFCTLEQIALPSMRIQIGTIEGACGLWGPWQTSRVAYELPRPAGDDPDLIRFRVRDLADPSVDYGAYQGLRESLHWSADGNRLAWCRSRRQAWELVLGTPPRRLEACPLGYTSSGALAFARGREIFVRGRRVAVAPGPIASASFGVDGSLALIVGRTVLRYGTFGDPNPIATVTLERPIRSAPIFSFDNCGVALRATQAGDPTVEIVGLACARAVARRVLPGIDAAWSPDSRWIVVAGAGEFAIYPVEGGEPHDRINVRARRILWQS